MTDEVSNTSEAKRSRLNGEDGLGLPSNPHLQELPSDFLYHIGYSREDVKDVFSDVKVRL